MKANKKIVKEMSREEEVNIIKNNIIKIDFDIRELNDYINKDPDYIYLPYDKKVILFHKRKILELAWKTSLQKMIA